MGILPPHRYNELIKVECKCDIYNFSIRLFQMAIHLQLGQVATSLPPLGRVKIIAGLFSTLFEILDPIADEE